MRYISREITANTAKIFPASSSAAVFCRCCLECVQQRDNYQKPCPHIGSVLLVLLKKQAEQVKALPATAAEIGKGLDAASANSSTQPQLDFDPETPLFVHEEMQLTEEMVEKETKLSEKLKRYSLVKLKALLERNGMKKTGNKEELVARAIFTTLPESTAVADTSISQRGKCVPAGSWPPLGTDPNGVCPDIAFPP
eukprot:g64709.t1